MLLRFEVSNYRSIRNHQHLGLVASNLSTRRPVPVPVRPSGELRVLPSVGIFGANGSGKSTVLAAMEELTQEVTVRPMRPEPSRRPTPFLLDETGPARPTQFSVDVLIDGVQYTYGYAMERGRVVREWLHAFPQGRRQVWFDREAGRADEFRFPGGHLRGGSARITGNVRPDALYLAVGSALNLQQLQPIYNWFHRLVFVPQRPPAVGEFQDAFATLFESENAERARTLVCRADLGIRDVRVVEHPVVGPTIELLHHGPDGDRPLPVTTESLGTHTWLWLLIDVLHALDLGGVLVVDEFDMLHPDLVAEVVRLFYDPIVNVKRAQLIFASHDPTILGSPTGEALLERDQIWFTEKRDGATELFPLSAFKPRKGENVERRYRLGHFGAVPDLSPGELAQAVRAAADPEAA
jgi:hypothetical protein